MKNFLTLLVIGVLSFPTLAQDIVPQKNIGLDLANDLAILSVKKCRDLGYQVASVVVDKNSTIKVSLRDDLASKFNLEIATKKANSAIFSNIPTTELIKNVADNARQFNHITGLIMMGGGVPITSGGNTIGAIGISGAPGGEIDEKCALDAIEQLQERIEFADED